MAKINNFKSQGKLLISGEYLVLDGAKALALPTIQGQKMRVEKEEDHKGIIHWQAYNTNNELWFETHINYKNLKVSHINPESKILQKVFSTSQVQKALKDKDQNFRIQTFLDFPKNWGLGTSSTFINNLAQWLQLDPYSLQWEVFGGSGYDIACAKETQPLIYQLQNGEPHIELVEINDQIKPYLYFIYLGNKQNSREAISKYRLKKPSKRQIEEISDITLNLVKARNIQEFEALIKAHNTLLSEILDMPSAQNIFYDAPFTVKNLGAWGGDFIMAVSKEKPNVYFEAKGLEVILKYHEVFGSSNNVIQ